MRIIVLTDSLGRARPDLKKDTTQYEDVYFSLLRDKFRLQDNLELILLTFEGIDTNLAIEQSKKSVAFRNPDIVIYHLGANDCSPRIFKRGSNPVIYRKWFSKITGNIFSKLITRYRRRITKFRKLVYVKPENFIENIHKMKVEVSKYSPDAVFFHVSIAESFDWMNNRSYGHLDNVRKYNQILKNEYGSNFIDINDLVPKVEDRLINDGVHFTKHTHQILAEKLYQDLSNLLKS